MENTITIKGRVIEVVLIIRALKLKYGNITLNELIKQLENGNNKERD